MERREFLKTATAATLAAAASASAASAQSTPSKTTRPQSPDMVYRQLGTTGETVSAIGLGGYHLGTQKLSADESIALIRKAIDHGITFMDNCWDYNDGTSEIRMGQALRDGYRDKVFLMTKMDGRTKQEFDRQLEQSFGRLRTDTIDLVQFVGAAGNDVEAIPLPPGSVAVMVNELLVAEVKVPSLAPTV